MNQDGNEETEQNTDLVNISLLFCRTNNKDIYPFGQIFNRGTSIIEISKYLQKGAEVDSIRQQMLSKVVKNLISRIGQQ